MAEARRDVGSICAMSIGAGAFDGEGEQCADAVGVSIREVALDPTCDSPPRRAAQLSENRLPIRDETAIDHCDERLVRPRAYII